MTAPPGGPGGTPPEKSEALFLVLEEVRRLVSEGFIVDAEALAARHRVPVAEVERCLAAVQAMGASPNTPGATVTSGPGRHPPESDLAAPPLPEDYEILGELGRGGMAVVYRARQKALDRVVAVKVLRPGEMLFDTMLRRFEKEAQTLAKLRHPHIVAIHEVGRAGANVFFAMDLIEGASLHDLIGQGAVTPTRAVKLLRQVASAISYAHSRGLIHRDLKPANILVDREDHAFVADFGLAREISGTEGMTHTGQILGTPAFMAPEQARGDAAAIGEPADIYAMGAILYECLTGRLPFEGKPLPELIHALLHEEPPRPRKVNPRVPRDLEVICLKAMEKDPARRYATAQAFLEDLERFEEGREIRARPPSVAYRMTKLAVRHRRSLLVSLVAAAMAGTVLWTVVRPLIGVTPATSLADADEALAAGHTDAALFLYERGLERSAEPEGQAASRLTNRLRIGLASCLLRVGEREEAAERFDRASEACARAGTTLAPVAAEEAAPLREECDERGTLIEARRGNLPALLERLRRPTWASRDPDSHRQGILDRAAPALEDPADPGHRAAVTALTATLALRDGRGAAAWLGDRGALGARLLPEIAAALAGLGPADGVNAAAGLEEAVAGLALFHASAMEAPLAAVAGDPSVPEAQQLLAARLLAVCADIPWWPETEGSGTTPGPADLARFWASSAALPREEAFRRRVDMALAAGGNASALRNLWLAARLGPAVPAATGAAEAWWREHRAEDPRDRLLAACGLDRGTTPGDVLDRLEGAPEEARPLLHALLLLLRPDGGPAPAWTLTPLKPEWTPSPPDLATAWQVALRGHLPEPALQIRIAQFASVDGDPDPRILWSEILPVRVGDRIRFERSRPLPPPEGPPGIRLEFRVLDLGDFFGKGAGIHLMGSGSNAGEFSASLRVDRRSGDILLRWSRCRFGERGNSFGTEEAVEGGLLLRLSQGLLADGRPMPVRRFCEQWVLARLERKGTPGSVDSTESWGEVLAGEIDRRAAPAEGAPGGEISRALYAAECAAFLPARSALSALARLDRALSGEGTGDRRLLPAARAAILSARLRAGEGTSLAGEAASERAWTDGSPVWPPGKHPLHWMQRWTVLSAAGGDPGVRAFAAARLSREHRRSITEGMADRLRAAARADPVPGAGWMRILPGRGFTGALGWILGGGLLAAFVVALVLSARPRIPLERRLRPTALALSLALLLPYLRIEIAGRALPLTLPAVLAATILSWAFLAGMPAPMRRQRIMVTACFALSFLFLVVGLRRHGGESPLNEVTWGLDGIMFFGAGSMGIGYMAVLVFRGTGPDGVMDPIIDPSWGRWAAFLARPTMSREKWNARVEKRRRSQRRSFLPFFRRGAERPVEERRRTWGDLLLELPSCFLQFPNWLVPVVFSLASFGSPWFAGARYLCAAMIAFPVVLLLTTADRRGTPPSVRERILGLLRRPREA